MQNEILTLLLPLGLIFGGLYIKNNPEKEPFASKNTWKSFVIIGCIWFVVKLITLIIEYV